MVPHPRQQPQHLLRAHHLQAQTLLHPRTALAHTRLLVAGTPVSEVGLGFGSLPYSGVTYFDVQKIKPDPKVFEVPSFCPK